MSLKNLNEKEYNWNFTKCRAKYKGHREVNYTFYIIDYWMGECPLYTYDAEGRVPLHITKLRNIKAIETKYFMKEEDAEQFIKDLKEVK